MIVNLISGITAKLAGAGIAAKAGLGLTMAAASVTGAGAAGVLPETVHSTVSNAVATVTPFEFPGPSDDEAVAASDDASDQDASTGDGETLPEEAVAGKETADQKRSAAEAYAAAVREWTACVAGNAGAHGDDQSGDDTRQPGAFDPREGCDERPDPSDYGLTTVPDQASDEAQPGSERDENEADEQRPAELPAPAEGTPADDSSQLDDTATDPGETNQPEDTPGAPGDTDTDTDDDSSSDQSSSGESDRPEAGAPSEVPSRP